MSVPYTGRCLCGAVRYRVNEEPLTFYACHCTDCQKRSGSSFGLSLWVKRAAIEVPPGEAALHVSSTGDGRARRGRGGRAARSRGSPSPRARRATIRSPRTSANSCGCGASAQRHSGSVA